MKARKDLSAKGLFNQVADSFRKLDNIYPKQGKIKTSDALLSCLAMFSLKYPSLLQFDIGQDEEVVKHNLNHLYNVSIVPSDTYMREMLDVISPLNLKDTYHNLFRIAQRGKVLERYLFMDKYYLVSADGTGFFSSHSVHCDSCCQKKHLNGTTTYYHQMLTAAIVHPDEPTVLPFAPEAIVKEDGSKKNDCERNASKRLIPAIRQAHPHLQMIIVEDGLASNGPHIDLLKKNNMHFILGAKPGDHAWLFDWVNNSDEVKTLEYKEDKKSYKLRYINNVPLNDRRSDLLVNFFECTETLQNGKQRTFSWITDLEVSDTNIKTLMKGARARWKIENETFNTLKNQGYHFEHNFGHGKKMLSTVMAHIMLLAFLIDQLQQTACKSFKEALKKVRNNRKFFWFKFKSIGLTIRVDSWDMFFDIMSGKIIMSAIPVQDSS